MFSVQVFIPINLYHSVGFRCDDWWLVVLLVVNFQLMLLILIFCYRFCKGLVSLASGHWVSLHIFRFWTEFLSLWLLLLFFLSYVPCWLWLWKWILSWLPFLMTSTFLLSCLLMFGTVRDLVFTCLCQLIRQGKVVAGSFRFQWCI